MSPNAGGTRADGLGYIKDEPKECGWLI